MAPVAWAGVRKDYDGTVALGGIDLDAADGELLVVLGPSGSGKTTLLRVTAGLEPVSAGSVSIGGRDVTAVPPGRRNVAMVFQTYALFPHLDVAENIGFGLEAREVPKRQRRERVAEAARIVGCSELLARRPAELSGGERQRVALARALVRDPDVFLLDEPLSNLDAQLRTQMRAELKDLQRRVGATMVYVTHDQVEALTLGDRLAVLRDGALQQVGTPEDVFARPATRFVAQFVGSPAMNIIRARLEPDALVVGPLRFPPPATAQDGKALDVGIRPERVRLADEGAPASVRLVELAGSEAFVHLTADGATLVVRVGADDRPRPGDAVQIAVSHRDLHLFDAETGQRLEWTP
jgi:ABC-type sugar transport system ATPase subunit